MLRRDLPFPGTYHYDTATEDYYQLSSRSEKDNRLVFLNLTTGKVLSVEPCSAIISPKGRLVAVGAFDTAGNYHNFKRVE